MIAAAALVSGIAYAHNGVEHLMGTVTAVTDSSLTVETVKHTSVIVLVNQTTKFTKNDSQIARRDVKVGDRVVIDAQVVSDKNLVGVVVKLGSAAHSDHSNQPTHTDRSDHNAPADHHKQ